MTTAGVDNSENLERSRVSRFRGDQLVIGLTYEHLVKGKLTEWGAAPQIAAEDRDGRLGLARATLLTGVAVAYLEEKRPDLVRSARAGAKAENYEPTPLDTLVRCLRLAFAEDCAGWVPTFAKNRLLDRVEGSHVIDGGMRGLRAGGPKPQPHVIDGGGSRDPQLVAAGRIVPPRAAKPGGGVRVGVIDTRVVPHPWLNGGFVADDDSLWPADSWSSLPDAAYHGTFVTGLILRQAPGATVEVRAVLDEEARTDSWDVARVIASFADAHLDVLNLSFGCATDDDRPPLVLTRALEVLGPRTTVVAAAGNHGTDRAGGRVPPSWPAALDDVVAVGATDGEKRAEFSPDVPWIDAMAPGVDVVSTWGVNRNDVPTFAAWNGTSFSAALVSGAIAARIEAGVQAAQAWQQLSKEPLMLRAGTSGRHVPVVSAKPPKGWPSA